MAAPFIDIPTMDGLFNSKPDDNNEPYVYLIPVTYLQNLSSGPMIIDSSSNIILQARNNHVRVNNKMGIGLDPSSAYSLHVLGDTCISGTIISTTINVRDVIVSSLDVSLNLNPLMPLTGSLGAPNKLWRNAYVNDVSVGSLDVSLNLNPLMPLTGSLGGPNKLWRNAYINDISVSSIDVSLNLNPLNPLTGSLGAPNKLWRNAYINDISVGSLDVSLNLNPRISLTGSLGAPNKLWRNAYINDVSVGSLDVSVNLNPLMPLSGSLGGPSKLWRNAYINDVSVGSLDVSLNLNPLNPLTGSLGAPNKLWRNAYINDISVTNISISGNLSSNTFNDLSSKYNRLESSFNGLSSNNSILNYNIASISYDLYSLLDSIIFGTGYYGTITLLNNSISDISFRVSWNPGSLPQEQEYIPNYVSVNSIDGSTNVNISRFSRLASRNSNFFLNIKLDANSFFNESLADSSYVTFNNGLINTISSEFLNNDSKHRITINVSNFDEFENIPFTIYYNPLYKGFFGTVRIGNKTSEASLDYSYNYTNISGSTVNIITSIIQTLNGSNFSNILINSNSRLANQNTPLNLTLRPQLGYDICTNPLVANIIGISNNILTSTRLFDNSAIYYNYNILSLSNNLLNGLIGLSFELYKTGFFGTFKLVNDTTDVNLDYSYNYLSISNSNVNSGLKTIIGSDFSNILISSNSRLAFPDSSLNLTLRPQLGYDISANASANGLDSNSSNFSERLFDNSAIYYNYNIVSLSNNLVNGTLGLSFELYKTGFFGVFGITNLTNELIFDYSFSYLSISNYNITSSLVRSGDGTTYARELTTINNETQFEGTINNEIQFGELVKFSNIAGNNKIFNALLGDPSFNNNGCLYVWSGTETSNNLVRFTINDPNVAYLGKTGNITNDASYIVSGSNNVGYLWNCSTGVSYEITIQDISSRYNSMHITGDGTKIFAGYPNTDNFSIYSWNEPTLTHLYSLEPNESSALNNSLSEKGFASSNDGKYFITSAYAASSDLFFNDGLTNNGGILFFHYDDNNNNFNVSQDELFIGNSNNSNLGYSITMDSLYGLWACAGAPGGSNPYVVIYKRTDNSWNIFQTIEKPENSTGFFGTSVCFDESALSLYITTKDSNAYYYTRASTSISFELTHTIVNSEFKSIAIASSRNGKQAILVSESNSESEQIKVNYLDLIDNNLLTFFDISSNSRLAFSETPLNLTLRPELGYDISLIDSSGLSVLTSTRLFDNSYIYYNANIVSLSNNLVNGTLSLSFELYRTGFFGNFRIGNASDVATLDYSYNYFTISDSNINSSLQTLNAFDASNILINSNSRLANSNSPLNLTLRPQVGYDISFDSSIKYGVQTINSNQRLFDSSAIYYNANILSLTNNLFNGILGLSFELYKTGFFGVFGIANLTNELIFDYSFSYLSISNYNITSSLVRSGDGTTYARELTTINNETQFEGTINNEIQFGELVKFSNIAGNNKIFNALLGDPSFNNNGCLYVWSGTETSNNLVRFTINDPNVAYLGKTGNITNDASYIVSGSNNVGYLWNCSTGVSYEITIQDISSRYNSMHITGDGTKIFAGYPNTDNFSIYSWNEPTLTHLYSLEPNESSALNNSLSEKGFASSNDGKYFITSAYAASSDLFFNDGLTNNGGILFFHYDDNNNNFNVSQDELFIGNSNNSNLGYSITMDSLYGLWACAGAPGGSNPYVVIYKRTDNSWNIFQTIEKPENSTGFFGTSVCFDESALSLYITTKDSNAYYYTRASTSISFELTHTIVNSEFKSIAIASSRNGKQAILVSESNSESEQIKVNYLDLIDNNLLTFFDISSNSRLAFSETPLNLTLRPELGYDISLIDSSGLSVLTSTRLFDNSYIYYNANIVSLSNNLVSGEIALITRLYRTGFFGTIELTNNLGYTIDYSYNYITLGESTIYVPSTSINNTLSNSSTISGELRLREASSQIEMNIRTSSSVTDISYTISGGTINNVVTTESSPYVYSNFNILPNINNLVNGTLTLNVLGPPPSNTGWYGDFTITNDGDSQAAMYITNLIRDDTNIDGVYPGLINLQTGEQITLTLTEAERLATPQTKFNIYWEGDEDGITTIANITGLTLVNYDTGYEPPGSVAVRANFTVDSAYINNQAIQLTILMTAP